MSQWRRRKKQKPAISSSIRGISPISDWPRTIPTSRCLVKKNINVINWFLRPLFFTEVENIWIYQCLMFMIGVPKLWLFNSSKNKGNLILKKNNDKLNIFGIIQGFSKIRIDKEKADNLLLLKETVRNLPPKVFYESVFSETSISS